MTGIVAHTYPEWWLKLTGQAAHWSTDYSGLEKGRNDTIFSFVQDGLISLSVGADRANLSVEAFKEEMIKAGYKLPDNV